MFDSPMTPKDSNNMSPRENENSENNEVSTYLITRHNIVQILSQSSYVIV